MPQGETHLLTVTLPNKRRIHLFKAIVWWSKGCEFPVENVTIARQPPTQLQQTVRQLARGRYAIARAHVY